MAMLSTSNLLWYIYKRNCAVGYPTAISMSQFCEAFPDATRKEIDQELDNLINGMHFIRCRFLCVYDLTEQGLKEVLHLQNFVINPSRQVWWILLVQLVVCFFGHRNKKEKNVLAIFFVLGVSVMLCLFANAENASDALNMDKTVDSLGLRIKRLSDKVNEASVYVENFVSNEIAVVTCGYEARLKEQLHKIDAEIGEAVKDREFYGKRYVELKAAEDRFMTHVNIFWTAMAIVVAIVGVFVTWFGIFKPQSSERKIKVEWKEAKKRLEALTDQSMRSVEEWNKTKAEFYFQLAKAVFAQYKIGRSIELLEITVKDLTKSIRHSVAGMDAEGLRAAIVFLNVILNKKPEDEELPTEIIKHRELLVSSLRTWRWEIDEDLIKIVFENSDLDSSHIKYSILNLKNIMGKYGVRGVA